MPAGAPAFHLPWKEAGNCTILHNRNETLQIAKYRILLRVGKGDKGGMEKAIVGVLKQHIPDHGVQRECTELLLHPPLTDIDALAPDTVLLLPVLQPLICNPDLGGIDWVVQHLQRSLHGKRSHIDHFENRVHPTICIAGGHHVSIESE